MSDYAKMKNPQLEALLKERGLPHTGKKADMIARLQAADEKTSAPKAAAEDEIDWDDDTGADTGAKPAEATSEPAAAAVAAGGKGQVPNPQAVPNQVVDEETFAGNDTSGQSSDNTAADAPKVTATDGEEAKVTDTAEKKPEVDFTSGLSATDLDKEIAARKRRAERFGTQATDEEAKEAFAKLERAKKFGEANGPAGLDEALPERSRKRGREGGDQGGRGGHKRRGGPQGRRNQARGGAGGAGGNRKNDRGAVEKPAHSGFSAKDKEAMEKRKARFA